MLMCFCEEPMALEKEKGNIFATRCGHLFHDSCLTQWMERSETCPQCRSLVTVNEMVRLYPALAEENANKDHNEILQTCLGSLEEARSQLENFKIRLQSDAERDKTVQQELTDLCKEKDGIIENLKTEVEREKTVQQELTDLCKVKDDIIENLKTDAERDKSVQQELTDLCREKDDIIENLKNDAEREKSVQQELMDLCQEKDDMIENIKTEMEKDKTLQQELIDLCKEKDDIIENLKSDAERDKNVQQELTDLCKEKDGIIENLKIDVERVKTLRESNETFGSLLQILDGLKDIATVICKTADKAVQQVTEPRTESSDSDTAITEPRAETSNDVISESRTEPSYVNAGSNQSETASSHVDADVTQSRTRSNWEHSDIDIVTLESSTESLNNPSMLEGTEINVGDNRLNTVLPDDATNQPSDSSEASDSNTALNQPNTELHQTDETNNDTGAGSIVDTETAAVKSSINILEKMLIRISEIKNSNRVL